MTPPARAVSLSITFPASFTVNTITAMAALMTAPTLASTPKSTFKPAGTGHIADVKGQTASYNEKGHQVPQPWENHVCNILSPFAGNTDNAPYIHLGDHVQDDGKENNKAEAGSQLLGKYGGLCQKPGPMEDVAIKRLRPEALSTVSISCLP